MYHKHLKIQKYICLLCVIAAAISFVYALGMATDIYDALYYAADLKGRADRDWVTGAQIYVQIQDFNNAFVNASVVLILLGCALFITQTNSRRKYYTTNYLAVGAYSIATVAVSIWAKIKICGYAKQYMQTIDFDELYNFSVENKSLYLDNTDLLDLHWAVFALALIAVAALLGNMIWKIILVRKENELLEAGKEAA